jgi:(1->4)-alpha-D-glucan 1-alpha-D-glucosylmutase
VQQPRSGYSRQSLLRCVARLQQYSGPVAAKGLEDTAFYRYNRFIAFNEVGGDPARFGAKLAAFHRANQFRAQRWPNAMLATSTHDTKRGEDARARLAALSEFPHEWAHQIPVWSRILRGPGVTTDGSGELLEPDRNDEYLLYQVLLGSWPGELLEQQYCQGEPLRVYSERVRATMLKSMREARVYTSWAFPNARYEDSMNALIDTALTGSRAGAFLASFLPFAREVAAIGAHNSLIQTVAKLTAPGVPDIYNGSELWDFSMVDPDNRRPVDYAARARLLAEIDSASNPDRGSQLAEWLREWPDGRIKLAVTRALLRHRADFAELYRVGEYQPLTASGPRAEQLGAYLRNHANHTALIAFARHPRQFGPRSFDDETFLPLAQTLAGRSWREILSNSAIAASDRLMPATLFAHLPVAVLVAD